MMSAIAAVWRRLGSAKSLSQNSGQPSSNCGQRPCRVKPRSRDGSHCGWSGSSPAEAPARGPGEREQEVAGIVQRARRRGDRCRDPEHRSRKGLYHPAHPPYIACRTPRENRPSRSGAPEFSAREARVLRGDCHGASIDAEGDRGLAGREHDADVPADRRVLRAARARGERHRRRRGGAGHQGVRPGRQPPADRRGDSPRRGGPEPSGCG